jgi:hypothetical protein
MKMTIEMDVNREQAITLREMFKYWNRLAGIGSSRYVAFFVDGDGNFHPDIKMEFSEELPKLEEKYLESAIKKNPHGYKVYEGDRFYDFDPIGWALLKKEHPEEFKRKV